MASVIGCCPAAGTASFAIMSRVISRKTVGGGREMNRKYKFHPGEYELGENEKFYSDMEARGHRVLLRHRDRLLRYYVSRYIV